MTPNNICHAINLSFSYNYFRSITPPGLKFLVFGRNYVQVGELHTITIILLILIVLTISITFSNKPNYSKHFFKCSYVYNIEFIPWQIVDIYWTHRPKWTESSSRCSGRAMFCLSSKIIKKYQILPECARIVVFVKNLKVVPVFAARTHVDGVFSVCSCLFYSNLQS